jgi:hypothetical protein
MGRKGVHGAVGWSSLLQAGMSAGAIIEIFHCGPGVDSASNRNDYQRCLLGVKEAGT